MPMRGSGRPTCRSWKPTAHPVSAAGSDPTTITSSPMVLMMRASSGSVSSTANIAVSLSGDDADELRGYWEKLSSGGSVSVPLEKQMWGDEFGMCVDRFGVAWMVNITQPQV